MGDVTVQLLSDNGMEIIVDMDYYKRLPFHIEEEVTITRSETKGVYTLTSVKSGLTGRVTLRNEANEKFIPHYE